MRNTLLLFQSKFFRLFYKTFCSKFLSLKKSKKCKLTFPAGGFVRTFRRVSLLLRDLCGPPLRRLVIFSSPGMAHYFYHLESL